MKTIKTALQFIFSIQNLVLFDPYKMQHTPIIYYKFLGIVFATKEIKN